MFRPYNLTSIAAWTVGSLAGNKAYYATKQKQAGLLGNQVGTVQVNFAAAGNPPYLQRIFNRCVNVGDEVVKLHEDLSSATNLETNTLNTTPLLKLIVYCNWLNSNKDHMKEEIRIALERAMRDGYVYENNIIRTLQAEADTLVNGVNVTKEHVIRYLNEMLAQDPQKKDEAFKVFDLIMAKMQVDERSWKLKEFDEEDGLHLVGLNEKSEATVARGKTVPESRRRDFVKDLYVARGSDTLGPYKYSQLLEWLKTGNIVLDDLVAYDGAAEWVKLEQLIAEVD
jgi:hypothetical protein